MPLGAVQLTLLPGFALDYIGNSSRRKEGPGNLSSSSLVADVDVGCDDALESSLEGSLVLPGLTV